MTDQPNVKRQAAIESCRGAVTRRRFRVGVAIAFAGFLGGHLLSASGPAGAGQEAADESRKCAGREVTVAGTAGPDLLTGTAGNDVLWGGPGADRIRGLGGRDIVCGGTGDDVIRAGTGRDEVFAGPGADFVSDRNWSSGLQGGPGADTIRSRTPEVFFKVPSSMYGGRGSDDLRGGRGADQIYGQRGPDTLRGGASPNTLVGGRGPDVVHPGPQGHVYLRGDGDHVFGVKGARVGLFYTFVSAEVHASLLSGEGHVQGRRRVDRLPTEADLIGSRYDDTLIGSDTLYQELIGLAGDDFIYGSGGSEDILMGPGDDYLDGGAPAQPAEEDQIAGGPGEDVCVSSADNTGCEINP